MDSCPINIYFAWTVKFSIFLLQNRNFSILPAGVSELYRAYIVSMAGLSES